MLAKSDRFYNPKDGTYADVPYVPVHAEKFRGKRQFNTDVLIGNWYEDRSKVSSNICDRSKQSFLSVSRLRLYT